MIFYIKLATLEYPRYEGDIRLEHPEIGSVFVCPETYAEVHYTAPPNSLIDSNGFPTTRIVLDTPSVANGIWVAEWKEVPITQQELDVMKSNLQELTNKQTLSMSEVKFT